MGSLFNFGRLTKVWKGLKFGFYGFGFKLSCFCGSYALLLGSCEFYVQPVKFERVLNLDLI